MLLGNNDLVPPHCKVNQKILIKDTGIHWKKKKKRYWDSEFTLKRKKLLSSVRRDCKNLKN